MTPAVAQIRSPGQSLRQTAYNAETGGQIIDPPAGRNHWALPGLDNSPTRSKDEDGQAGSWREPDYGFLNEGVSSVVCIYFKAQMGQDFQGMR
jgi:hypothetical protein